MAGFRAYLGVVDGRVVYNFADTVEVSGWYNCRFITLGFARQNMYHELKFEAIDPTRPIVIAASCNAREIGFYVFEKHMAAEPAVGMDSYKSFRSKDMLVDYNTVSKSTSHCSEAYWAVAVGGMTFAQTWSGNVFDHRFGNAWQVELDRLCAFIGGEYGDRGLHELRAHAARYKRTRGVSDPKRLEDRLRESERETREALAQVRHLQATANADEAFIDSFGDRLGLIEAERDLLRRMFEDTLNRLRSIVVMRRPFFNWRRLVAQTVRDVSSLLPPK